MFEIRKLNAKEEGSVCRTCSTANFETKVYDNLGEIYEIKFGGSRAGMVVEQCRDCLINNGAKMILEAFKEDEENGR